MAYIALVFLPTGVVVAAVELEHLVQMQRQPAVTAVTVVRPSLPAAQRRMPAAVAVAVVRLLVPTVQMHRPVVQAVLVAAEPEHQQAAE